MGILSSSIEYTHLTLSNELVVDEKEEETGIRQEKWVDFPLFARSGPMKHSMNY